MDIMSRILREAFVDMYKEHDVLQELRDHAVETIGDSSIPQPPLTGGLDLDRVLESNYFFG
jgi:DNA-directed RNA polymerase